MNSAKLRERPCYWKAVCLSGRKTTTSLDRISVTTPVIHHSRFIYSINTPN